MHLDTQTFTANETEPTGARSMLTKRENNFFVNHPFYRTIKRYRSSRKNYNSGIGSIEVDILDILELVPDLLLKFMI